MKTPYRILIDVGEKATSLEMLDSHTAISYLTKDQFDSQLRRPNDRWNCPKTGAIGWFDDEWYEEGFSAWMDEIADFMDDEC